jgi:hypothetical protein
MLPTVDNPERFAVVAVLRDEAMIWRHGIGAEDLPEHIYPPTEVDHRHMRTGQFQRGHDTAHRFPEYFDDIADQLRDFEGILIIGHGTGKAAYGKLLLNFLHRKHPDLYAKVVDTLTLNLSAISPSEIKASARSWFEKNYRTLSSWHDRTRDRRFS